MKPPLTWYGGKQKLAKHIIDLIPAHHCYVEPFFGGGAVFFKKEPSVVEVINDKNNLLINFYKVLQDKKKCKELIALLNVTPYSRVFYSEATNIIKNFDPSNNLSDVVLAQMFFICIMQAFGKKIGAGWGYGRARSESKVFNNRIDLLGEHHNRLKDAMIDSRCALEVIDKYKGADTVYYLDPPYIDTNQGHYKGYVKEDFQKLIDKISTTQGYFILSHYENDIVPDDWQKIIIETKCTVRKDIGTKRDSRKEYIYIIDNRYI